LPGRAIPDFGRDPTFVNPCVQRRRTRANHATSERAGQLAGRELAAGEQRIDELHRREGVAGEVEHREVVVRRAGARRPADAGEPLGLPVEHAGAMPAGVMKSVGVFVVVPDGRSELVKLAAAICTLLTVAPVSCNAVSTVSEYVGCTALV